LGQIKDRDPKKGNLNEVAPDKSIGGDIWKNKKKQLPESKTYYEVDVGYKKGYRGTERIVYSEDGKIYMINDYYETFMEIK
jgi:hypothetical protein